MAPIQSTFLAFSTCFQRISICFLWLLLLTRVGAQHQSPEVGILLNFIQMILNGNPGAGFGYYSSWDATDENPCSWIGVTCTSNSTVEELNLSGWDLPGPVPGPVPSVGELSQLTDLRQLDLSSNNFGDALPDDFSLLTMVTFLDLSQNKFSGSIPSNISECRSLRFLNLEQNMLEGAIPNLSGLVNLQVLVLANNQLTGPFPNDLGEMNSLAAIDISNNMLDGPIPSLLNLIHLLDLHLDNNNFTKFEEPLSPAAKSLQHFTVSGNQLDGMIPPGITNLQNLQSLDMSRNQLSGSVPSGFSRLWNGSLLSLDLSQNQLTGEIPHDLLIVPNNWAARWEGLSINLSHNFLNGSVMLYNSDFGPNTFVDLSYNQLTGPIGPMIFSPYNAPIGSLWLDNNLFSEDIVEVFLEQNSLGHTISADELRLGNNLFSGDLSRMVDQWSTFTELPEILDLRNNNLQMSTSDAIPDPLGATLRSLVSALQGSGSGRSLELWIGGNNLSGTSVPTTYFNDTEGFIKTLDLSNNHLTGEISGQIFNRTWLPGLQLLNLSFNEISGPVPGSIIMLPNLTVLDVSNNNLSGPLPVIPLTSRFYDPRIFTGNDELCGDPLSRCYPSPQQSRTGVQWWVLLVIVAGSVAIVMVSALAAAWRWRVYHKRHQQDADLIRTLQERESATLMSLREIKKATNNFAASAQIGEGGFGTVYAGKLTDGTAVAIKRSKREGSEDEKKQFLNEVRILSQVRHRNLVRLLGCCMENKVAVLVFEFISNGTLQEHLQGKRGVAPLSWKQRLNIAVQTADALSYLHSEAIFPIYHRDVKSANILLDDYLDAKVADFGISRLAPRQATHVSTAAVQGTMGYIDPEYYQSFQLTDRSDVYSFGVVLLELISAKPVVDFLRGGENTSLVNFAVPHIVRGHLQGFIDPALEEIFNDLAGHAERESILNVGGLAMQCLDIRYKARPSMIEVRKELQNLWLKLCGISKPVEFASENDDEDSMIEFDHKHLLSESLWGDSSRNVMQSDARSIQMSESSHPVEGAESGKLGKSVRSVSFQGL